MENFPTVHKRWGIGGTQTLCEPLESALLAPLFLGTEITGTAGFRFQTWSKRSALYSGFRGIQIGEKLYESSGPVLSFYRQET